jgi:hypothetical protein
MLYWLPRRRFVELLFGLLQAFFCFSVPSSFLTFTFIIRFLSRKVKGFSEKRGEKMKIV